jgi:cellulose biosynthesis protein BcsQ
MAKKIFIGNYKGGVGKTTTAFEIGAGLAKNHKKKVLLIDLDPQCSLTQICLQVAGLKMESLPVQDTLNYALELYCENINNTTRLQILEGGIPSVYKHINTLIKKIPQHGHLHFASTSLFLKNSRINDIADKFSRNRNSILAVAKLLSDIETENNFDYILIDCPPSSNIIIHGIFLYCDYYLIPTIGDEISVNGVTDYITEIESTYLKYAYDDYIGGILINKYFGIKPKLLGILETIYKNRAYATDCSPGNTYRDSSNLSALKGLDASVTKVLSEPSVISQNPKYQYSGIKNIFKNLIRNLDNRSTPGNYGIPITVSNGDIHDEYNGITDIINDII